MSKTKKLIASALAPGDGSGGAADDVALFWATDGPLGIRSGSGLGWGRVDQGGAAARFGPGTGDAGQRSHRGRADDGAGRQAAAEAGCSDLASPGAPAAGGEGRTAFDPHIWLSPDNAQAIVLAMAASLAASDPSHAAAYTANAQAMNRRIAVVADDIRDLLDPVRGRAFILFHDGFQYFERAFGLTAAGSLTS